MKHQKNEIVIFIINLFFLLILSKVLVLAALWLFRFFGMPQLWNWFAELDHPDRWRFYIVLIICTSYSIYRILHNRNIGSK